MSEIKNTVPKYVFDKEYSTQWRKEVKFLEDKGINYTYAKKHYKYPIIRYKYTKTPELFLALAEFYHQVRTEQFFKDVSAVGDKVKLPIEEGHIDIPAAELTEPEKKLLNVTEEEVMDVFSADDTE